MKGALMSSRWLLPLLVLAGALIAQPKEIPVMPYDSLMSDRASVDGMIEEVEDEGDVPEYPATFADKKTGLKVHWGFDDEYLYVALESRSKGWMAIGFGSAKMDGANMMLGYYTDDSAEVFNEVGKGYGHSVAPGSDSLFEEWEIDHDDETGVTVMEFVYPLKFPKIEGLAIPEMIGGDTYDLILATNSRSVDRGAAHSQRSALKFRMAEVPPKPEPKKEGGEK
jgi:hypothetical protein